MKKLLQKIDNLFESIEMGLLTRSEAMTQIKDLRNEILNKYEEGSDNFMTCIYPLIDCNNLINTI